MATTTTATNPEVLKQYWRDEFLKEYEANLTFKQFGLMGSVPAGTGTTVNWFQFSNLAVGSTITESSDPTSTSITTTVQSASLVQKGAFVAITDVQMRQAADNFMDIVMKRVGRQVADTEDQQVRDTIFSAGGMIEYGGTAAFRNSIADGSSFDMSIAKLRKGVFKLESANALPHPMAKNGARYCGIVGPAAKYDLQADTNWTDIAIYTEKNVGRIAANEVGTIYGVNFYESTNALTLTNSGSANADVVQTYLIAGEYFGVAEAVAPEIVTEMPSPKSELGLYSTIGFKYLTAHKQLHASGMVRFETSTSTETRI